MIFSNHTEDGINTQLERLKLVPYFALVRANTIKSGSNFSGKKHTWVREYFDASRLAPREALIIGDSPEETRIGKELGLVTVAITMGEYDTAKLKQAKPDHLITKVSELIEIIKEYD